MDLRRRYLADLLRVKLVARIALLNGAHHQCLAKVVHFGDNVARALGLDALEVLVAVHLDAPGPMGHLDREIHLGAESQGSPERATGTGQGGRHQPDIPASRAISMVRSIDRFSSSSGR